MSDNDICSAAYRKERSLVEELIRQGANIESQDRDGRTPLLNAVSGPDIDLELVAFLVDEGANTNAQDKSGFSALHFCSQNERPDVAEFLINRGANVHLLDQWGNTPLFRCLGTGSKRAQLIDLYLSHDVDPSLKNKSGVSVMDHVLRLVSHPNHDYFKAIKQSDT